MNKPKAQFGWPFYLMIAAMVCYVAAIVYSAVCMITANVAGMILGGVLMGVFFELAMWLVDQWRKANGLKFLDRETAEAME